MIKAFGEARLTAAPGRSPLSCGSDASVWPSYPASESCRSMWPLSVLPLYKSSRNYTLAYGFEEPLVANAALGSVNFQDMNSRRPVETRDALHAGNLPKRRLLRKQRTQFRPKVLEQTELIHQARVVDSATHCHLANGLGRGRPISSPNAVLEIVKHGRFLGPSFSARNCSK